MIILKVWHSWHLEDICKDRVRSSHWECVSTWDSWSTVWFQTWTSNNGHDILCEIVQERNLEQQTTPYRFDTEKRQSRLFCGNISWAFVRNYMERDVSQLNDEFSVKKGGCQLGRFSSPELFSIYSAALFFLLWFQGLQQRNQICNLIQKQRLSQNLLENNFMMMTWICWHTSCWEGGCKCNILMGRIPTSCVYFGLYN